MQKLLIFGFIMVFLALNGLYLVFNTDAQKLQKTQSKVVLDIETRKDKNNLVSRIVDGDTIVVIINDIPEKVRLIGVNTPETVDPRRPVQCFGKEASSFTASILANTYVKIEADSSQSNRDKYGRLLRYVFLSDGTLVNKKIISEGYGYEYTYKTPYKHQKEFKKAELEAKKNKKGLWADGACAN